MDPGVAPRRFGRGCAEEETQPRSQSLSSAEAGWSVSTLPLGILSHYLERPDAGIGTQPNTFSIMHRWEL
jgi:hypothetical protein